MASWTIALLIAQQVAAKATRDALFLGAHKPAQLPPVMLASAGLSLFTIIFFTRFLRMRGPGRVVPFCLGLSSSFYVLEWGLALRAPALAAWAVYIHLSVFGGIAISGFWSIFAELFDPNSAKKLIGRIGGGATLGGVLGALAVERLSSLIQVRDNLLLLATLHLTAAFCLSKLATRSTSLSSRDIRKTTPTTTSSGLGLISSSRYLKLLILLVCLTATIGALIDFSFKANASAYFKTNHELLRFFAAFYAATSLLTFLTQTFLTRASLNRFGLGGTLALLPGAIFLLSIAGVAITRLSTMMALKGVSSVLENSMHRSGYELLYTPLNPQTKRATKALIDVGSDRIGSMLGAGIVLLILAALPLAAPRLAIVVAAILAVVAVLTAWRLHKGYVTALVTSLKGGTLDPEHLDIRDATTKQTINDTTMALDRDRLLAEIARFRAQSEPDPIAENKDALKDLSKDNPSYHEKKLYRTAVLLCDSEQETIRELLRDPQSIPPALGGLVIRLLGDPLLAASAKRTLQELAPQIMGQLHDALLAPDLPLNIRRKLPEILATEASPRSVIALTDGLTLPRFSLRFRIAQSLVSMQSADPSLVQLSRGTIHSLVLQELRCEKSSPPHRPGERSINLERDDALLSISPSMNNESSGWLTSELKRKLHRRLQHAFTLLSLVHRRAPLELSLSALFGEDEILRGTALEYLENVLPPKIMTALAPYLEERKPPSTETARSPDDMINELLRSVDSLTLDTSLFELKKK